MNLLTGWVRMDGLIYNVIEAGVKRRTSHWPNRMLTRENKGSFSFAFDSVHVKYGV